MTSAPKTEQPVDDYAATVVLDERTATSVETPDTTGETLTGDYVQDIEAALRSELGR